MEKRNMKKPYLQRLQEGVLLFDGAVGTMLYEKGIFVNQCFENANIEAPDLVLELHTEMAEAGAQALTTNSFGANPVRLESYSLREKTREINMRAVELARSVAGDELYVAGSVGPLGKTLAPVGSFSREEAEQAFRIQMEALRDAGIDLFILETFKNLDELLLATRVARETAPEIPIQSQFSFRPHRKEGLDTDIQYVFSSLQHEAAVDVAGLNCSTGPAFMLDILQKIQGIVTKPISVMPNAGFPREYEGRQLYMASPDYFAEYALKFLDAGATVVGGCCGTTPEHIRKMAQAILSLGKARKKQMSLELPPLVPEAEISPVPIQERSALGAKLAAGEWITSIELVPPRGTSLDKILEKAKSLEQSGVTCINIPDGPRASSRISTMVTAMKIRDHTSIEIIPHLTCRDKNIIGLQAELLGAQAAGLRNLLLLTGDPPKVGNYPEATGVFDIDSIGLISLARKLNRGIDLAGKPLNAPTSFVIGAGTNPAAPVLEREIDRTFRKIEAGAEFLITQPIFDVELLEFFLEKMRSTGIPIIAGVWPLSSYRNACFLHNEVPGVTIPQSILDRMERHPEKEEALEEGIAIVREIIRDIKPLITGIQISPPFGRLDTALRILESDSL
jgi:homocysteine S-methyltransferase